MIIQFPFQGRTVTATDDIPVYFANSENKELLYSAFDIAKNCLDCTFSVIHPHYPKTVKPDLFIADEKEANAVNDSNENRIVIFSGLIERISELIEKRYSDDRIAQYNLIPEYSSKGVRSIIRSYVWRFVLLHELYHNWHSHVKWESMYYFDITGMLCKKAGAPAKVESIMDEKAEMLFFSITDIVRQQCITSQAKEFDADSAAVSMLINLMVVDHRNRSRLSPGPSLLEFARNHVALIGGALATTFCVFDGNNGAQFEKLDGDKLPLFTHPIPAIRMSYAEEIIGAALMGFFKTRDEIDYIRSGWDLVVTDLESDKDGDVSWKNLFYFSANTEIAQKHIVLLKRRLMDMYDTMSELATGNMPEKLNEEDLEYPEFAVLFSDKGESLRGWK